MGQEVDVVRVHKKWHYICVFVDLFNREIVGFSTGENKDALLVPSSIVNKRELAYDSNVPY
jgi:hypothetical protein